MDDVMRSPDPRARMFHRAPKSGAARCLYFLLKEGRCQCPVVTRRRLLALLGLVVAVSFLFRGRSEAGRGGAAGASWGMGLSDSYARGADGLRGPHRPGGHAEPSLEKQLELASTLERIREDKVRLEQSLAATRADLDRERSAKTRGGGETKMSKNLGSESKGSGGGGAAGGGGGGDDEGGKSASRSRIEELEAKLEALQKESKARGARATRAEGQAQAFAAKATAAAADAAKAAANVARMEAEKANSAEDAAAAPSSSPSLPSKYTTPQDHRASGRTESSKAGTTEDIWANQQWLPVQTQEPSELKLHRWFCGLSDVRWDRLHRAQRDHSLHRRYADAADASGGGGGGGGGGNAGRASGGSDASGSSNKCPDPATAGEADLRRLSLADRDAAYARQVLLGEVHSASLVHDLATALVDIERGVEHAAETAAAGGGATAQPPPGGGGPGAAGQSNPSSFSSAQSRPWTMMSKLSSASSSFFKWASSKMPWRVTGKHASQRIAMAHLEKLLGRGSSGGGYGGGGGGGGGGAGGGHGPHHGHDFRRVRVAVSADWGIFYRVRVPVTDLRDTGGGGAAAASGDHHMFGREDVVDGGGGGGGGGNSDAADGTDQFAYRIRCFHRRWILPSRSETTVTRTHAFRVAAAGANAAADGGQEGTSLSSGDRMRAGGNRLAALPIWPGRGGAWLAAAAAAATTTSQRGGGGGQGSWNATRARLPAPPVWWPKDGPSDRSAADPPAVRWTAVMPLPAVQLVVPFLHTVYPAAAGVSAGVSAGGDAAPSCGPKQNGANPTRSKDKTRGAQVLRHSSERTARLIRGIVAMAHGLSAQHAARSRQQRSPPNAAATPVAPWSLALLPVHHQAAMRASPTCYGQELGKIRAVLAFKSSSKKKNNKAASAAADSGLYTAGAAELVQAPGLATGASGGHQPHIGSSLHDLLVAKQGDGGQKQQQAISPNDVVVVTNPSALLQWAPPAGATQSNATGRGGGGGGGLGDEASWHWWRKVVDALPPAVPLEGHGVAVVGFTRGPRQRRLANLMANATAAPPGSIATPDWHDAESTGAPPLFVAARRADLQAAINRLWPSPSSSGGGVSSGAAAEQPSFSEEQAGARAWQCFYRRLAASLQAGGARVMRMSINVNSEAAEPPLIVSSPMSSTSAAAAAGGHPRGAGASAAPHAASSSRPGASPSSPTTVAQQQQQQQQQAGDGGKPKDKVALMAEASRKRFMATRGNATWVKMMKERKERLKKGGGGGGAAAAATTAPATTLEKSGGRRATRRRLLFQDMVASGRPTAADRPRCPTDTLLPTDSHGQQVEWQDAAWRAPWWSEVIADGGGNHGTTSRSSGSTKAQNRASQPTTAAAAAAAVRQRRSTTLRQDVVGGDPNDLRWAMCHRPLLEGMIVQHGPPKAASAGSSSSSSSSSKSSPGAGESAEAQPPSIVGIDWTDRYVDPWRGLSYAVTAIAKPAAAGAKAPGSDSGGGGGLSLERYRIGFHIGLGRGIVEELH